MMAVHENMIEMARKMPSMVSIVLVLRISLAYGYKNSRKYSHIIECTNELCTMSQYESGER